MLDIRRVVTGHNDRSSFFAEFVDYPVSHGYPLVIEGVHRFVKDQIPGIFHDRLSDPQTLLHAKRVILDLCSERVSQSHVVKHQLKLFGADFFSDRRQHFEIFKPRVSSDKSRRIDYHSRVRDKIALVSEAFAVNNNLAVVGLRETADQL